MLCILAPLNRVIKLLSDLASALAISYPERRGSVMSYNSSSVFIFYLVNDLSCAWSDLTDLNCIMNVPEATFKAKATESSSVHF